MVKGRVDSGIQEFKLRSVAVLLPIHDFVPILVAFLDVSESVCKSNAVLPALTVHTAFYSCLSLSSSGPF